MSEANETLRKALGELREALLHLHKALLDSEKARYEQAHGKIPSPGAFLQLVTGDPWFAWLRPFSWLIVSLDEAMDGKESMTKETAAALLQEVQTQLVPNPAGQGASPRYLEALQRDPHVAMMHPEVTSLLRAAQAQL